MRKQASGFTLIELVMVIVILGILAATALPKFINLRQEAATAATAGVAGGLGAASAINKAGNLAGNTNAIAITNCQDVSNAMDGGLAAGYTVGSLAVTAGATANCAVTHTATTTTANFVGHGV